MKKIYLFFTFLFLTLLGNAQQIGMYGHFYFKPMVYNPAFTGFDEGINAMIISRNQWTGFKGAPQLNLFSLDGNINNKAGVGLQVISDRKGILNRMGGNVSYSYWLKLNDDTRLALGVSVGVIDQTIDFAKATVENNADPTLFTMQEHSTILDANAGLAFKWKALDVGVAVPQLMANKVKYLDNVDVRAFYTQTRHYMGSLKYRIPVMEDNGIFVIPTGLVRYLPNTPIQYDGTLTIDWKDKIWVGGTYKSDYAVGINAGICIQKSLFVGYSYDFITGSIGKYAGLSHEIMINFRFGTKKKEVPPQPQVTKQPVTPLKMENKVYENRMDSLERVLKEMQENLKKQEVKTPVLPPVKMENKVYESRMDSLERALKENQENSEKQEVKEFTVPPVKMENKVYENRMDSLDRALKESQGTVRKLEEKLDQHLKSQEQTPVAPLIAEKKPVEDNRNSEAIESNVNKVMIDSVWLVTNLSKDFMDDQNHEPQIGFYVIVGTFIYRDLANAEAVRFVEKGYRTANWVYYDEKKFNYVYIERIILQEEALRKAKELRKSGIKDVWIQELIKEPSTK